ncbi:MAG TPA: hypothetical protein PLD02_11555, partial [Saprospiraceae bacterium]|nr:hypothetical protein [Saprospiraceae bacterium]
QPQQLPNPIVNIQNAPGAPDPSGLAATLGLLGQSNAFKDTTGLEGNQRNAMQAFQSSLDAAQGFAQGAANLEIQKNMERRLDKVINEINSNSNLTPEQKRQLTEKAFNSYLGAGATTSTDNMHPQSPLDRHASSIEANMDRATSFTHRDPKGETSIQFAKFASDKDIIEPHKINDVKFFKTDDRLPEGHFIIHKAFPFLNMLDESFEVLKVWDSQNYNYYQIAFDSKGKEIDFDMVLQREDTKFYEKYKKIHPYLYNKLEDINNSTEIPVALWFYLKIDDLNLGEFRSEDWNNENIKDEILTYKQRLSESKEIVRDFLLNSLNITILEEMEIVPYIHFMATKDQILEIANHEIVTRIDFYEGERVQQLIDSMNISNATTPISNGIRGHGINVGIWESPGPMTSVSLSIQGMFDANQSTPSPHADMVAAMISNTQQGGTNGFAPDANLFSGNSWDIRALQYLIDNSCNVIICPNRPKPHFGNTRILDFSTSSIDDLLDWVADMSDLIVGMPRLHIFVASGNDPLLEVSYKGFNFLKIGNLDDSTLSISTNSSYLNPYSILNDRELPELCANGTTISAIGQYDPGGTSLSAAAVAGIAASLLSGPIGNNIPTFVIRAILMASAYSIPSKNQTWFDDIMNHRDRKEGAGVVDMELANNILNNPIISTNQPSFIGWHERIVRESDFDQISQNLGIKHHIHISNFSYQVQIPAGSTSRNTNVKIVLAWNSDTINNAYPNDKKKSYINRMLFDFDLFVYDNNGLNIPPISLSTSFDNNYEVVEFLGQPGITYFVRIGLNGRGGFGPPFLLPIKHYAIAWHSF